MLDLLFGFRNCGLSHYDIKVVAVVSNAMANGKKLKI